MGNSSRHSMASSYHLPVAELQEILLSSDRFQSEVISEAVKAGGYQVEIVHDESSGGVGTPPQQSRLLVHQQDADAVREIVNRSYALDAPSMHGSHAPLTSSPRTRFIGLVLLFVLVGVPCVLWIAGSIF